MAFWKISLEPLNDKKGTWFTPEDWQFLAKNKLVVIGDHLYAFKKFINIRKGDYHSRRKTPSFSYGDIRRTLTFKTN